MFFNAITGSLPLYDNWFPTTILATILYDNSGFLLLYWLLFYMITGSLPLYDNWFPTTILATII